VSFEGDDQEAVTQAVNWLGEFLCRSDEYKVRTASGPRVIAPDESVSIIDYLDLIRDWHDKSKEMIDFITSASLVSPDMTPTTLPTTEPHDPIHQPSTETMIDLTHGPHPPTTSPIACSASTPPLPADSAPASENETMPIPLILLRRYQLHASNTYAHHIPLGPTYTPIDHWQWMATLWRGTLGPDLTVYIKDYDEASLGLGNNAGGTTASMQELLGRNKGVEVMQEKGLVVVWRRKGAVVGEAALRRVAFEVGEGARGVWEGR